MIDLAILPISWTDSEWAGAYRRSPILAQVLNAEC